MTKNMGGLDRGLRVVVGIGLIAAAAMGPADPWGYIGVVPLLTAAIGYCPAYRLLGICTTGGKAKA